MRRRDSRRRAEPPEDDGPGALTAAELAERFVGALLDHAREVTVDAGDAAAMAALDKPISPLRQRMIDDMTARRFNEHTLCLE
jgi:hypothetical protein